jgi:2-polyprenyl-3-methyl-5-hydroxy-6-metoxy-1,4-benzoquinol methylase
MNKVESQAHDVSHFFSRFSNDWDSLYGGKRNLLWRAFDSTFRRDIGERYEFTFEALGGDLAGKSILDIGCGSGIYSLEAAKRGASRVLGIDAAKGMIELAHRLAQEAGPSSVCRFVCANFPPDTSVPDLKDKFDAAIVMGVMDYVSDPIRFLRAVNERVKDFAVVSFPYIDLFRYPLRKFRYRLLRRCQVYHYSERDVRETCEQSGFSRIDVRFVAHSGGCFFVKAYV